MTDSHAARTGGKRERLITAAVTLMHQRGVDTPTLVQIAHAAGVPPGNVYYYFRTRDDLVDAVLEARADGIRELLGRLDQLVSPRDRLHALLDLWADNVADITRSGCPIGTLCTELTKRNEPERTGAPLLSMTVAWAIEQFRQLDYADPAAPATTMVAIVQGAALLASTFQDPDVLTTEMEKLRSWIDRLADGDGTTANPHDHHTQRHGSTTP